GNAPVTEQHEDFVTDRGIDEALVGNVPVHKNICRIEDFGDRRARRQRLADMRETCRNDSGDRRKDPALAEMLLHLIETAAKLLDKLIKGGKLNGGLCEFCLLRNDGFARRGILAQDFHSEGHGSRGHSAEALYRFLGYELIRASCFERVLRD